MSFLSSSFLWALPLASIPLLLHLFRRKNSKPVVFSHIQWIRHVHEQQMPRRQIHEWLLLLLRTLFLLCLIFYFSQPRFDSAGSWGSDKNQSALIFLVDVSASMGQISGGQSALQHAQSQLTKLIRRLPASVRCGWISYSNRVHDQHPLTLDRSDLISSLERLKIQPRPTDISVGFREVLKQFDAMSHTQKRVVVVSDGAHHGWEKLSQDKALLADLNNSSMAILNWNIISPVKENMGVSDVWFEESAHGLLKGHVEFLNQLHSEKKTPWNLSLQGRSVTQGVVPTLQDGKRIISLQIPWSQEGLFQGQVVLEADELPFDDVFYFSGKTSKNYSLLLIDGESGTSPTESETFYFRAALESPRDPHLQSLSFLRQESFSSVSHQQIVVLANARILPAEIKEKLMLNIQTGGQCLLTAGSQWIDGKDPMGLFKTEGIKKETIQIDESSLRSYLKLDDRQKFDVSLTRIHQYIHVTPDEKDQVKITLSNGAPLLIQRRVGKGQVLILLTSIDREWTSMPGKPLFSPLVRTMVRDLAHPFSQPGKTSYVVGEKVSVTLPPGVNAESVVLPDSSQKSVSTTLSGVVQLPEFNEPGWVYLKTSDSQSDQVFSVNIEDAQKEGRVDPLPESEFNIYFKNIPHDYVEAFESNGDKVNAILQGRDMTRLFLGLALLFFAFESLIVLFGKRIFKFGMALLIVFLAQGVQAETGNQFVWAQVQHQGNWDPYPQIAEPIFQMVRSYTNIALYPEKVVVTLDQQQIFKYPFLVVAGNEALSLTKDQKKRLQQYIERGGLVFFDDTLADSRGKFSVSVRQMMKELFPSYPMKLSDRDHSVYRTFFLLRNPAGRRISEKYLEIMDLPASAGGQSRTAVLLSTNDLLGTWVKDASGAYAYSCNPGAEVQRWDSHKLTLNIIYFSLTGTYKKDAVHQPFIERKYGSEP